MARFGKARDYFYKASPVRRRRAVAGGLVLIMGLGALVNSLALGGASGTVTNRWLARHYSYLKPIQKLASTATTSPPTTTTDPPTTTTHPPTTTTDPPTTTTDPPTTTTDPPTTTTDPPTTTTDPPTTTTDPPTTPSVQSSGLVQAGDSKTNCIYLGGAQTINVTSGISPLAQVEANTGITFNCIETFSDADPTWADWVSPWVTISGAYYGYADWLKADPGGRTIILTQNLIPDSEENDSNWTADCAAGNFDTYATQLAQNLVATGFGSSVIRLGDEMNGNWEQDSLGTTQAEWTQWDQCWDHEVTAMRAVAGANFLFDWNVNANYRDLPLASIYPGNAYVDIIGIDAYDSTGVAIPATGQPGRFAALAGEPDGLDAVEAFAAANNKPLSIPEWGCVAAGSATNAGGDDADYVTNMGTFVATHDVAFQSYFDPNDDGILPLDPSQAPLSLAAYSKAFG